MVVGRTKLLSPTPLPAVTQGRLPEGPAARAGDSLRTGSCPAGQPGAVAAHPDWSGMRQPTPGPEGATWSRPRRDTLTHHPQPPGETLDARARCPGGPRRWADAAVRSARTWSQKGRCAIRGRAAETRGLWVGAGQGGRWRQGRAGGGRTALGDTRVRG